MPRRILITVAILISLCPATDAIAAGLGDIVARMPAKDTAEGLPLAAEIVKLGPAGLKKLCGMITPPEKTGDAKARFALHGVALYVKRPGAETERAMVERALLDALAAAGNDEVKAFFIRQIQLAGSDAAAGPLGKLLSHKRLYEPATQALLRIGTPACAAQLRGALPAARGKNLVTVVRALGKARDKVSAKAILPRAGAADRTLRHTAWFALANIGDASATAALAKAAEAKGNYERLLGTKYYLLLARRLGEAGSAEACEKICRGLLAARTKPADGNVRCAALRILADALGPKALNDVLAALSGPNVYVRDAAVAILGRMRAPGATAQLVGRLKGASPQVKAAIVGLLGRSGDKDALDALLSAASDKDKSVRLAAIEALVGVAPERAADVAAAAMKTTDAAEIAAARAALLRLKFQGLSAAVAGGLAKASPAGKVALLEVLAARGAGDQKQAIFPLLDDKDEHVRLAAARALGVLAGPADISRIIRQILAAKDPSEQATLRNAVVTLCRRTGAGAKPIIEVLSRARGARRAVLLPALAGVGGRDALPVVLEDTRCNDKAVQDAAVRALADWPDPLAIGHLLALARTTKNEVHRTLAIRGYIRLVSLPSNRLPAHTADMFGKILAVASTSTDKKLALGSLSKVRAVEALTLAIKYFDDSAVREEAAMAAVKIACPAKRGGKGLRGPAVREALERIVKVAKSKWTLNAARAYLRSMPPVDAANLTQGRPVTATGKQERNYRPENAVDGNLDQESAWHAQPSPCSLTVDIEQPARIDTVRVIFYWGDERHYRYDVQVSLDGRKWTKVVDNSGNTKLSTPAGQVHRFDVVEARYVRLNVIKNSANYAIHVVEFEVYAAGKAPKSFKTATATAAPRPAAKRSPARQPRPAPLGKPDKDGFISLFNGKDLTGWVGSTKGYGAEDGVMFCKRGGNLFTDKEFGDFILKFDFKLPPGANNGLAIRSPLRGDPAYAGMELQILDNKAKRWARLRPVQYHGSIYDVVAAKRGHLKPTGQWNTQEVRAIGPKITVILNGATIVNADLDKICKAGGPKLIARHPGLKRTKGHIGWLGHGARVEFRNIRVKPISAQVAGPLNTPPEGFIAVFNGKDITGWKGLVGNPKSRAAMSKEKLAAEQAKADERAKKHWKAIDGVLVFDGKGKALCTAKDYGDFEMYVDWKIHKGGDSGIYLRGSPQLQIWDRPEGSGALYNNKKNPRKPLVCADNPPGQWNTFRIKMIGDRVWVWLNGKKVVDNTVMENYWERNKPIYPTGQIELQHHGSTLWFRNIYIREIPRKDG